MAVAKLAKFLSKRILRIELPYIASICLTVALAYLSTLSPSFRGAQLQMSLPQILANIFYVVPFTKAAWIQPVYWTLAYEFAFYLFMSVGFAPIVSSARPRLFYSLTALLCALAISGVAPSHFLLFIMGCAVYRRLNRLADLVECVATIGLPFVVFITRGEWLESVVGAATAIVLIVGCFTRLPGAAGAVLAWLGSISYSLYLVHVPIGGRVVNLGRRFVSGEASDLVLSLTALMTSILFSWIFYKMIEQPAHRLARSLKPLRGTLSFLTVPEKG